jgi:competence protein ComFC
VVNLMWPAMCPVCKTVDSLLCDECMKQMSLGGGLCMGCGRMSVTGWTHATCRDKTAFAGVVALYDYEDGPVRQVINSIKYHFDRELIRHICSKQLFEMGESFDGVSFVPLTRTRKNWRGFNQAEDMAVYVADQLGLPSGPLLRKVRDNGQQASKKTRKERVSGMSGVYELKPGCVVMGKKVILVDDVLTTGATMEACAKVLKSAGASSVWGLVLAHEMDGA